MNTTFHNKEIFFWGKPKTKIVLSFLLYLVLAVVCVFAMRTSFVEGRDIEGTVWAISAAVIASLAVSMVALFFHERNQLLPDKNGDKEN